MTEQSSGVIDTAMARLGGEVMRRPAGDVEQEIAAAQEAQRKAKREARKELHKARLQQGKEDVHAKVEELKSKLHRPKAGAVANHNRRRRYAHSRRVAAAVRPEAFVLGRQPSRRGLLRDALQASLHGWENPPHPRPFRNGGVFTEGLDNGREP